MLGEAPIPGSPLRPDPCTRAMGGAASPWKSGVRGRGAAWLRWSFTPGPCAQKPGERVHRQGRRPAQLNER